MFPFPWQPFWVLLPELALADSDLSSGHSPYLKWEKLSLESTDDSSDGDSHRGLGNAQKSIKDFTCVCGKYARLC